MDRNKLIRLREAISSEDGQLIINECHRYMVEISAMSNSDAEWIKGMGLLVNRLLSIDEECQRLNNRER